MRTLSTSPTLVTTLLTALVGTCLTGCTEKGAITATYPAVRVVPAAELDEVLLLLRAENPVYPEEARAAGHEGTVIVRAGVDADGTIWSAVVESSSGYPELDRSAVRAAYQYRFRPPRHRGQSVRTCCVLLPPFRFRLG